ncbi:MAG TPA: hypothetical protein VFO60_00075 [Candidatus Dormibacteraeota bacterium]|nr:hypothetical protein [Candidatus Dormibacteraeota bacterium]
MPAVLDKPSLLFVIGIPVGFVLFSIGVGWVFYSLIGRILHDE